ncbi:MAG TPA: hypothetical protein VIX83_10865 [Candidatus Cybelea sp.]
MTARSARRNARGVNSATSSSIPLLAGCGGLQSPAPLPAQSSKTMGTHKHTSPYIPHIIVLIQENRSFDDFFATFPGADGTTTGKRGNETVKLGQVRIMSAARPARCKIDIVEVLRSGHRQ